MTFTQTLTLGLTGEVPAVAEVHLLHSFGKHELVDSACGREGKERENDKMKNEETCAAESQKRIN